MASRIFAFLLIFSLLFSFAVRGVFASDVTLPDYVYADLAVRHELNDVSVYYFDDNIANTITISDTKRWVPASTIKVYVAMYAIDQVAAGNLSLDQKVTIEDKNVVPSMSFPDGLPPLIAGDTLSVYELVYRMVAQSGNTSYNTLLDILDRRKITKYIHDLGLINSSVGGKLNLDDVQEAKDSQTPGYGPNVTNANDFGTAFILINGGRIPGSTALFNILAHQKSNDMIPALLPKSVLVAHKTGELDPYWHDGGIIVAPNRKYVLSIFSDAGSPSLVAHISSLIYTQDENMVGADIRPEVAEEPLPPLDPMVLTAQKPEESNVLAADTADIKIPALTASDVGIDSADLASDLSQSQLPKVTIPADSALHFLVDLGDKITSSLVPIPYYKVIIETGKLKLKLAEADDLVARGKTAEANNILKDIDSRLGNLAKENVVSNIPNLQILIDQVSETRFSVFKEELSSLNKAGRGNLIKEIAKEAKNEIENVAPYTQGATKAKDLSQKPTVGEVVSTTPVSITVKTQGGKHVTVPLLGNIKTRKEGDINVQMKNANQILKGTKVAIAGSFVLTDVSNEQINSKPERVLKVNPKTKTLVTTSDTGVPIQVDTTKNTVIKGSNTNVTLSEIKSGDIVVVQGEPINTPGPKTPSAKTPSGNPTVIKSSVITVVEKSSDTKPSKKEEKKEGKKETPKVPPANLPSKEEEKKK